LGVESTGTIRDLISQLYGRMDRQDRVLDEIKAQVTRTNGRVTALETKEAVSKALGERAELERNELRVSKQDRGDRFTTLQAGLGGAALSTVLYVAAHVAHWI
jgi:hypothetical protein